MPAIPACSCPMCREAEGLVPEPVSVWRAINQDDMVEFQYERDDDDEDDEYEDTYEDEDYDESEDCGDVHGYGYLPPLHFYRTDSFGNVCQDEAPVPGLTYLGFELETESPRGQLAEGASLFRREERYWFLTHDGSLENGFEITSHPMTLEAHRTLIARSRRLSSRLHGLRDLGFRAWDTDTCGLHVHVGRTAFQSREHLWRFCQLISRNEGPVCELAGRKDEQWASFRNQRKDNSDIVLGKDTYPERYRAVNLGNADTVEIRIFKPSLRVERLIGHLEFVDACVTYTRGLTHRAVRFGALDWSAFNAWVGKHAYLYPQLAKLVRDSRLLPA